MLMTIDIRHTRFELPEAVQGRLDWLLDRRDSGRPLSDDERDEAAGLVEIAEFLSLLQLHVSKMKSHPMNWSGLKQLVEANFAPELQGHVQFRLIFYPHSRHYPERGVIVVNGEEWIEFSTVKYKREDYKRSQAIGYTERAMQFKQKQLEAMRTKDKKKVFDLLLSGESKKLDADQALIEQQMKADMFMSIGDFLGACSSFLDMSIDDAITSDNPLHRLLAILDKRVGEDHLLNIREHYLEPELLRKFYQLRLDATHGKTI